MSERSKPLSTSESIFPILRADGPLPAGVIFSDDASLPGNLKKIGTGGAAVDVVIWKPPCHEQLVESCRAINLCKTFEDDTIDTYVGSGWPLPGEPAATGARLSLVETIKSYPA